MVLLCGLESYRCFLVDEGHEYKLKGLRLEEYKELRPNPRGGYKFLGDPARSDE